MRNRTIIFIVVQIIALLIFIPLLHAWTGDTWGSISRQTILRVADEMIDFSWTPKNNITNQTSNDYPWLVYSSGTVYYGEAYSLYNDQNWSEFYGTVNNTPGGTTACGNDCSDFVSMSWRLPTIYNTTGFENDAKSDGGYVTKLGEKGTGENVGLLLGDAFVASGSHIVLFESYWYDSYGRRAGINSMEQSTYPKQRAVRNYNYWTWSKLASYRPIRRNNIDEGNYIFKTKWGKQGNLNGQFNYPTDVAVDSSGNVFVVDSDNYRIQKFSSDGGFVTKWGGHGSGNEQFNDPEGVAVDSSGNIYVTDSGSPSRVKKFTNNGSFTTSWEAGLYYGCTMGSLWYADVYGITVSSSGSVYVTNSGNLEAPCFSLFGNFVQKFNSNGGSPLTEWGDGDCGYFCCTGNVYLCGPHGIDVDSFGNVYVADTLNYRIQKFNSNGGFITNWGSCCGGNGYFRCPYGVAVDSSLNVYVVDQYNHLIQKFDSNGTFLTKWGSYSYWEDGKFQYPEGIAIDSFLNVYVADTDNHRIQKFSPVSPLPSGPYNLTAATASSTQINLLWQDNSNNETGFKIKRKAGVNGTYSTIATVGANVTSYSDSVSPGSTYYYAVYAYNAYGDSVYSDEAEATSGTGTVIQRATLDGSPWSGSLTFQCSANGILGPVQTVNLPVTATNRPTGTRTCAYISGGPQGATFYGIAPSATQTLYNGGTITFTYAFSSGTGTIIHQATLNGSPWSGSLTFQCSANGILGPVQTVNVPLTSTNRPTGPRTCAYISGGPTGAVFTSITPSNTQILYPGRTITFTYNFKK